MTPSEAQTLHSAGLKAKQKQLSQLRETRKNTEFNALCYQVTRRVEDNRTKECDSKTKLFNKINP